MTDISGSPIGTDDGADAVGAALRQMAPDLVHSLNVDFEDSMLLLARVLGRRPAATAATVTSIDRGGIDMVVTDTEGAHPTRLDFAAPLTDPTGINAELFALVTRARQMSGEPGETSAERMMAEMAAIRTFVTHVVEVEDVRPHLRRITFGGGDLAGFAPVGPDTFVYVLLPPPGRTDLTVDQGFTWEAVGQMPPEDQPVGAYYTVRRWRPDVAEIDALFVLHGDSGPASAWAARARPGDPVALWGPRTSWAPPADTEWYLLVADETGLPAVAAILESLPDGTVARVFAEVADAREHQDLPEAPGFQVTWLHRDGAEPGTTSLLADAVRAMDWPGDRPYVFGGGESRAMTALRRHVRDTIGLPRDAVSLVAYWRRADHTDSADSADNAEHRDTADHTGDGATTRTAESHA